MSAILDQPDEPQLAAEVAPAVVPVTAAHRATRNRERNFVPYEHVVSVSGGKDSTALYCLAVDHAAKAAEPGA